jgi:gamma-glutamyltranspeptidase/glutathione hydrolase
VKLHHLIILFLVLAGLLVSGPAVAVESPAHGDSCLVVSAHPLATEVGLAILLQGGNAFDAGVATALALAVVEPYSSGLGGGGFLVSYEAGPERFRALDAREVAPRDAHRDMYLDGDRVDPRLSRDGPLAVAVPGLVRGLERLHREMGTLPWADLVEPARRLAESGFPVSSLLQARIAYHAHRFNPAARAIFLPGNEVPAVGDLLVQRDLSRSLAAIAEHGGDAFYTGPIARDIVATVRQDHSRGLTLADLKDYHPQWRQPLIGTYRGLTMASMPPPSSGGVHLLQMLALLEPFDLAATGFGSAATGHLLAEVMKFAYADRSLYLGDSDFVPVPLEMLLSADRTDSLRALIDPGRAYPEAAIVGAPLVPAESDETTHFSVVDARGNALAATLTINLSFGSGWVAAGTGIVLNDEMDDFVAAPGLPNAFGLVGGEANSIAPGKRPLSSMTPTIVLDGREVRMVTGAPGGSKIISTTLQTIINVVDHGMDALQAVSAPRLHHQWYPRVLYHEHFGLSPDTAVLLTAKGHVLQARSPMCNAQIIVRDRQTGALTGASDPRGMGMAQGR